MELKELSDATVWKEFFAHVEKQGKWSAEKLADLQAFIERRDYIDVVNRMRSGNSFAPPTKHLISKTNSAKKRVVYTFPPAQMYVLKLLAHRLHEYDGLFSKHLYSFRCHLNAKSAFEYFRNSGINGNCYSYKVDISNYFNSVPVDRMLKILQNYFGDSELYNFFHVLLSDKRVLWQGEVITEEKGIMAGTPTAAFLANLYLADLDALFEDSAYARYSDDIILFAESAEECAQKAQQLKAFLNEKGLSVNTEKEIWTNPGEPWNFLGITVNGTTCDISEISMQKLKAKLHRRARSIERWKRRMGATTQQAARAFIRAVNRKLYHNSTASELTWCRWYFPLINTDKSLHELDTYIQSCVRYVVFGNYGKKTYELTYRDIKELGYRSLVHEYYL